MRAALFWGVEKGVTIETVEKPVPQAGDLLIRVKCASLCHSDFSLLDGSQQPPSLPLLPGHEATGTVESIGDGVANFKVGDEVGFILYYHPCGQCQACSVSPMACAQVKIQGFTANGYFAEYCVVDAKSALKIPSGMDLISAAPLFCAGLTAFHSVVKCKLGPSDWIGVVGVGGLGHLAIQYATKMGLKVVALDIDDKKLEHAKELGATLSYNTSNADFVPLLRSATGGGVAAACVFSAAMPAYNIALQTIAIGGTLMCVGMPNGQLPITAIPIAMGLLHVEGASSGKPDEMSKCIEFSHEHSIHPKVQKFQLEQLPEMLDLMSKGKFEGRMAVVF